MANSAEVQGAWRRGWTLDVHTTSSEFLGYDHNGHAQFNTTRSPLGELVYQLKYRGQTRAAEQIAGLMAEFLEANPHSLARIDVIIPMPASSARSTQPVVEVAKALGRRLGKPAVLDAITKAKETPGIKDVHDPEKRRELLDGAFRVDAARILGKGILLIDDLYRSGATANAVTVSLIAAGVPAVYLLAATRTRSNA